MILMTSAAFTAIFCASSATEIVSGTSTSRTIGSVGAWKLVSVSSSCFSLPRRLRQPSRPPLASPRVLMPRRLARSSAHEPAGLSAFLTVFFSALASFSPGFSTGRCSVPSLGGGSFLSTTRSPMRGRFSSTASVAVAAFVASATGAVACASPAFVLRLVAGFAIVSVAPAGASSVISESFFAPRLGGAFAFCSACLASNAVCRSSSPRRLASSTSFRIGCGGSTGFSGSTTSVFSTFTNVRFLRTSTWIVRALPVASDFLISVVCLRVRVIFFFSSL